MKHPFFSVLIPTRNRHDILKLSLFSLTNQTLQDLEIIISDNSDSETQEKNKSYVDNLNLPNIKYLRPPQVLNMHDNWEFGLSHATGHYQGVLIDKTLLKQTALLELQNILKKKESDIINYLHTGITCHPSKIFRYQLDNYPPASTHLIETYSPQIELQKRFSFEIPRGSSIKHYNIGKICFGFYHIDLIKKTKERYGRLFHANCCDYTSCSLALSCAESGIFYHNELLLAINNFQGNGSSWSKVPGSAMNFLRTCDITLSFLKDLPIPNLYSSVNNIIAYDYQIVNRLGNNMYQIDLGNLIKKSIQDLIDFPFISESEKKEQLTLLNNLAKKENIVTPEPPEDKAKPNFPQKLFNYIFNKSITQKIGAFQSRYHRNFLSLKSLLR